jgi:DNA-binding winged helix-turn-helix (wHTH) protein
MAAHFVHEYRFGPYILDPLRGTLRKQGKDQRAHLRMVRFLLVLVERPGTTVNRASLKKRLWPSRVDIPDGHLDVLVCQVRKLLGDDGKKPRFIRTYANHGYRFICPVNTPPSMIDESARSTAIAICEIARHRWSLRTPENIRESIQLYSSAIKEDPTFAIARSGRADAWIMAGIHCLIPPRDAFLRARSDAGDALRISCNLPEAIISEAWVKLCYDRNCVAAKRDFCRGVRLKPEYPFAHNGLTLLHIALGQPERAVKAMENAWRSRAASPFLNALLADSLYHARHYDQAAERGRLAIEFDPNLPLGHACLGRIYLQQGKFGEALKHLESARYLSGGNAIMLGFLAYGYASAGETSKARSILNDFLKQRAAKTQYVPPFFIALAYVGLGNRTLALAEIRQAVQERSHWVLFLRTDPMFDPVRNDRRFRSLMNTV